MSILHLAMIGAAMTMVPAVHGAPKEVRVQYGDLDLASPSGRDKLDRRLVQAVNTVCGKTQGEPLYRWMHIRKCHRLTNADIAPQRRLAILEKGGVIVARAY